MKIDIIGTGSDGNCFLFEDSLLIDCGLSYKKLSSAVDLSEITHILLTHIHGDHLNRTSVRKVSIKYDNIVWVCGDFLEKELVQIGVENIKVIEPNIIYELGKFKCASFDLYHDVPNIGYRLAYNGHSHIHTTDTSTLDGIKAESYDTATIECNHEENKALDIIENGKNDGEFSHLSGAMNSHLSVQQTVQFCKDNRIKQLTPVHVGNSTKSEVYEYLSSCDVPILRKCNIV